MLRQSAAALLSVLLVLGSFPAAAQVRFSAPEAPAPVDSIDSSSLSREAGEGWGEGQPLEVRSDESAESLSTLSNVDSLTSMDSASPLTSRAFSIRTALIRPSATFSRYAGEGKARQKQSLSSRVLNHAARQGFAFRSTSAVEVDDSTSLESPRSSIQRLPALHSAPSEPKQDGAPAGRSDRVSPAWQFLASMAFVDIGVEALSVAVPQLAASLSGHFLSASSVSTVAFAALTAGTLLAGPIVDRLGFRKVYAGVQATRAAGAVGLAVLHATGAISLPSLTFLFGLDFLLQGVSRVAEGVLPTLLYGSKPLDVNRFGTRFQMMIEVCGIAIPAGTGLLIASKGFGPVLAAYPALMLASAAITWLKLRLPRPSGAKPSDGGAIWAKGRIKDVFSALKTNPGLRRAAVGYGLALAMTNFIYFSIAPAYGLFVAHDPLAAARVASTLISFYGLGGFLGTGVLAGLDALAKRHLKLLWQGDQRRVFLMGTTGWLWAGAFSFLGAWALIWAPQVGAWLGYAAMVPFGIAMAGVSVRLETLIKSDAPEHVRGSVLSIVRAAALLFATLGFLALGGLFEWFSTAGAVPVPTVGAFVALAAALVPGSLIYIWVAHGLKKEARKSKEGK